MVIMVPQYRDTLVDLISELSANHVQGIINQLKGGPGRLLIDLKIPKFSIEKKSSLAIALQQVRPELEDTTHKSSHPIVMSDRA